MYTHLILKRNYASNLPVLEPPSHIRTLKASLLLFLCLHRLKLFLLHSQGLSAFIHEANRDGQAPSKRMMFEETRKRKYGRRYKKSYDDTLDKIEKMKELEVLQETGLSDSDIDPFDRVMGSAQNGRVQLYGRGVSMKNLKEKGLEVKSDGKSVVVPEEYVDAISCSLATDMQKDFEAQKQKLALDMKQEFETQKDKMVEDVVTKAFGRLREMFPDMATDALGQVVMSSVFADQ